MKAVIEFPDYMYDDFCNLLDRIDDYPTSITVVSNEHPNVLKIGDEVFVHGYVDEIRKDTIIIRNEGGYFGTVKEEIRKY